VQEKGANKGEPELTEKQKQRKALMPFVIISSSYLLFTITDGSVRMIVLLHAYNKNFSAMEVAVMFTLYETAGVVTNLLAGMAGAKWGIRWTLLTGLSLQFAGLGMLFGWQDDWDKGTAIVYVIFAQMLSGISKDLTKLGGKTVTKLVTPEEKQGRLFKLVSWITGFKNSLKGAGYFIGAACINASDEWGYYLALSVNCFLILCAIPWAYVGLSKDLGTAKSKNVSLRDALFDINHNLGWLSFARLFLFASRDLWFEVPLPFYLRSPPCREIGISCMANRDICSEGTLCDYPDNADLLFKDKVTDSFTDVCLNINEGGGCGGVGLNRVLVGTFLALYIIVYGQMQAFTPQLALKPLRQAPPNKYSEILWGYINCAPTLAMGIAMYAAPAFRDNNPDEQLVALIACISAFAIIFAINSSIHSYLVVRYADGNKVATSVGFYYMSNAMGRLMGTLVSDALYSYVADADNGQNDATKGIGACFFAGTAASVLAAMIT